MPEASLHPLPIYKLLQRQYPIYPLIGLPATVIGTILAILLVPIDPTPAGVLLVSALIMVLGLLIAPIFSLFRNPVTLLRTEYCLVLAPIYWLLLDLIQGAYDVNLERTTVRLTFAAIGLFVCGVWLSTLQKPWSLPRIITHSASYSLGSNTIFKLILIFFCLGFSKFAIASDFDPQVMFFYLLQNRWNAPWNRGMLGGWDAFLDHMAYFGYLLPTLTTLYGIRSRRFRLNLIISILLSTTMVAFLAHGGGRRVIGVVIGSALICWVLEQRKLTFKRLIIALSATIFLLSGMQLMLEYRNIGFQGWVSQENHIQSQYNYLHVDDNFLRLGQIIDFVPKKYPFVYEKQVVFALVRPIPRVFWPGKPINAGFDLAEANNRYGISFSSSVIGEFYLSLGWFAVFLGGWLYGRLAGMVSLLLIRNVESANVLLYSLFTMALFAGVRSMLDLILMSYAVVAWILVSAFAISKQKQYRLH